MESGHGVVLTVNEEEEESDALQQLNKGDYLSKKPSVHFQLTTLCGCHSAYSHANALWIDKSDRLVFRSARLFSSHSSYGAHTSMLTRCCCFILESCLYGWRRRTQLTLIEFFWLALKNFLRTFDEGFSWNEFKSTSIEMESWRTQEVIDDVDLKRNIFDEYCYESSKSESG